ncbi:MAG: hypothetical protein HQK89_10365 [Nitrospirae bacterium]|nr:hypothetical protein [Nitrospirota bacterium]
MVLGLAGKKTERFREVILNETDVSGLHIIDSVPSYSGDGNLLRLGLQACALGIAYEYDPYFGLSISRVDPLTHHKD